MSISIGVSFYSELFFYGFVPAQILEILKRLFFHLLLWELVLAIAISYVFFKLFYSYVLQKEEFDEFLTILFQSISHKFGNWLSAQKINLILVKENQDIEAIECMQKSIDFMEKDLRQILQVVSTFQSGKYSIENIDVAKLITDIIKELTPLYFKNIKIHLQSIKINALKVEIKLMLFLLLENAFKYSQNKIFIRTGKFKKKYFFVSNDINDNISSGSGLGLFLVKKIVKKRNIYFRVKQENGRFLALIVWT